MRTSCWLAAGAAALVLSGCSGSSSPAAKSPPSPTAAPTTATPAEPAPATTTPAARPTEQAVGGLPVRTVTTHERYGKAMAVTLSLPVFSGDLGPAVNRRVQRSAHDAEAAWGEGAQFPADLTITG